MVWTDDKIKLLKKLWTSGKSTVEIGHLLGLSKNAVIGKAHRMGLPTRPSPIKSEGPVPKQRKEKEQDNKPVTLMDLKLNSCRWPIGDPKDPDFHFCGKQIVTGKPYCSEHCKMAYTSIKELTLQNARLKQEEKMKSEQAGEVEAAPLKETKKEAPQKGDSKNVKGKPAAEKKVVPKTEKQPVKKPQPAPKTVPVKKKSEAVKNKKAVPTKPIKNKKLVEKTMQKIKSKPQKAIKKPSKPVKKIAPKVKIQPKKPAAKATVKAKTSKPIKSIKKILKKVIKKQPVKNKKRR
ncbi:MAG: hypothetical protein LBU87_07000 [Lactobacillales bacterium]|nr:hypothetical protein [Lactobacillales bacterium]